MWNISLTSVMNENLWFMHLTVVGRIGSARQVHGMWVRENLCLIQSALPFEISFEKCVRLSHHKKGRGKIKFKLWSQFEVVHDRSSSQFCHEIDLRDSLAVDSPEQGRIAVRAGKNKWRGRGWIIVLAGGQVAVFNTQVAGKMLGRCVSGQGSNDDISATKNLSQVKDL